MNNAFFYQALTSFASESSRYTFPRFLKDIVKAGDIDSAQALLDQLADELANAAIQDGKTSEYFTFLSENALYFALYREDYERFDAYMEIAQRRHNMLKYYEKSEAWYAYLAFLKLAAGRLRREVPVEQFEHFLDELDWSDVDPALISRYSGMTGYVYLNETDTARYSKSRFWLQKAVSEASGEQGLVHSLHLAEFYFSERKADATRKVEEIIARIENEAKNSKAPGVPALLRYAIMELQAKALIFRFASYDDESVKLEDNLGSIREIEKSIDVEGKKAPAYVRAFLKRDFARYYASLTSYDLDKEDIEDLLAMSVECMKESLSLARKLKDTAVEDSLRALQFSFACKRKAKPADKEVKDMLAHARKTLNLPQAVFIAETLAEYYVRNRERQKAFEACAELIRMGQKRLATGGLYLIASGLAPIAENFVAMTEAPSITWMVTEIEPFFAKIAEIIDEVENHKDAVGREVFDAFRTAYMRMEPASHFNIRVYYRYQWYSIRLLRVSGVFSNDAHAVQLADNLIQELQDKNNPLTFIQANWEDFKDVPNSVRNKTLNKCISISKGDLPYAADHLIFSYRNLRSYITFQEVNRLGFFLDQSQTNLKQLEQGIRFMFHDLYKDGTIFEVVFDMPKFLVETSKTGFSSLDMEEALEIKGTTAKKYIKIMMEIGLIKHDRSQGRKHFYKLRKDNVMTRLGKESKVLA